MSESPENSNKVTAKTYGSVIVDTVPHDCWMIRIPTKLAEAWDQAPEGTVLGELVFTKGGKAANGKPDVKPSFSIEAQPVVDDPTLPLHYSLQAMTKKIPAMIPFSRRANGSVKLHGTISRTANCQVAQITDSNYRQLCKTRLLQTTVNNQRYVKPVESNQVVSQSSKHTYKTIKKDGFGNAVHLYGKRLLEQQQAASSNLANAKRAKFEKDQPTKSVIFQLFSQQHYWTVKDLKVASGGRPESEIRDVLKEIGEYHRTGDHKNTWELRKEFSNQKG